MEFRTLSSPHSPRANSTSRMMQQVLLALVPLIATMFWLFGWGVLINLVLASLIALGAEALALKLRQRPLAPALGDYSALVTAWLFALSVPANLPWWLTLIGVAFAILVVKQLYGGLGYNPFNPVAAAYVLLLVSWPLHMTIWPNPVLAGEHLPSLTEALGIIFQGQLPQGMSLDSLTGPTPFDDLRNQLKQGQTLETILPGPLWGALGGRAWEWIGLAALIGGLWLIYRRVITWHIPVSMLLTLFLLAMVFHTWDPSLYPNGFLHIFSGAALFGAFFIATDPITAATTKKGQLVYGALIGVLVYVIRTWGGYPDGVAFGVLLMNLAAPTIDRYLRPRVMGHGGFDG